MRRQAEQRLAGLRDPTIAVAPPTIPLEEIVLAPRLSEMTQSEMNSSKEQKSTDLTIHRSEPSNR